MDRNISKPFRPEPHISKSKIRVAQTRLHDIKNKFDENINDIKSKFEIIDMLLAGPPNQQEINGAESLLRAQVLFLESAFDYYMHELFEFGMIMMFNDSWERSAYYNSRKISMIDVDRLIEGYRSTKWFDQHIRNKRLKSMLSTNEIKVVLGALNISEASIANFLGYNDADNVKNIANMCTDIEKVSQRRNEIAHNCDIKNGTKQPITTAMVNQYIEIIVNFVDAIHIEASKK